MDFTTVLAERKAMCSLHGTDDAVIEEAHRLRDRTHPLPSYIRRRIVFGRYEKIQEEFAYSPGSFGILVKIYTSEFA